jgi:hypothetical protein
MLHTLNIYDNNENIWIKYNQAILSEQGGKEGNRGEK